MTSKTGSYVVNRRYQRKLIWTLEEKRNFIDSIIEGYPVPIILLAESARRDDNSLEIIDGMQRLDAIFSFIGNKYSVRESYFDLNTIAVTKALLDGGKLIQRDPVMARDECVRIASYLLPLSIYEFADEKAVDTVFRRINSGGRQLSRQELRAQPDTSARVDRKVSSVFRWLKYSIRAVIPGWALRSAGAVGHFATVVRRVSAKVRGDDSYSDILRLNEMQAISITNRELDYGISVERIFWVSQGILSRDNVRQSRDEELIADIVAFMVSDDPLSSRTEFLDDFYGMSTDTPSQERFAAIDTAVQRRSSDLVIADFQRTLDQIQMTLAQAEMTFVQLLFGTPISPAPPHHPSV